jgi:hypothetical protein
MLEIQDRNESAIITADYQTVRSFLGNHPYWGADVLENSGEYHYRIRRAQRYSKGKMGCKILNESDGNCIAWGITGQKSFLAYRIIRENIRLRIIPLAYLERTRKTAIAVSLSMLFIVPVMLAPLIWKIYEKQTLRNSRVNLPTFCRYLLQG